MMYSGLLRSALVNSSNDSSHRVTTGTPAKTLLARPNPKSRLSFSECDQIQTLYVKMELVLKRQAFSLSVYLILHGSEVLSDYGSQSIADTTKGVYLV